MSALTHWIYPLGGALLLSLALYQVIELYVLHRGSRDTSSAPIMGIEAYIGRTVEVTESFLRTEPAAPAYGRVQVGSESWRAELVSSPASLALVGEQVLVVGAAGFLLRVKSVTSNQRFERQ
jgi:membrane protein implicated in regulation of membrane protease activity